MLPTPREKEDICLMLLDVDGVLNYRDFDGTLSIEHLLRLKKIINCTDCVIVLSTSWRRIPSAKNELFRQLSSPQIGIDINKSIIGDNPNYGNMSIFRGY